MSPKENNVSFHIIDPLLTEFVRVNIGLVLFFACLWNSQKENLAIFPIISPLDRDIVIRKPYMFICPKREGTKCA